MSKLSRRYPNLWGYLSTGLGYNALARDVDYAVKFLDEFQDRLCFGTDICFATQPLPLASFLRDLKKREISRSGPLKRSLIKTQNVCSIFESGLPADRAELMPSHF